MQYTSFGCSELDTVFYSLLVKVLQILKANSYLQIPVFAFKKNTIQNSLLFLNFVIFVRLLIKVVDNKCQPVILK